MNNNNYLILLPPSEGKNIGGRQIYQEVKNNNSFNFLEEHRRYLYDKLLSYILNLDNNKLEKLFNIKGKLIEQSIFLIKDHYNQKTLPAINRYLGVMFKYLEYDNLTIDLKNRANQVLLFTDALFGLLKPLDLIPNYKLSITAKFINNDSVFHIDKYWKDILKEHLKEIFKDKIIIDLLPTSHRKTIDPDIIKFHKQYYLINFYQLKNNIPKNTGHISKQLKGEFIRYILNNNNLTKETITKFTHSENYNYNEGLSKNNNIIFLK
jgi:cytoplasmic iron level regulating protein YaaA (DUF328/UPF0246 family)